MISLIKFFNSSEIKQGIQTVNVQKSWNSSNGKNNLEEMVNSVWENIKETGFLLENCENASKKAIKKIIKEEFDQKFKEEAEKIATRIGFKSKIFIECGVGQAILKDPTNWRKELRKCPYSAREQELRKIEGKIKQTALTLKQFSSKISKELNIDKNSVFTELMKLGKDALVLFELFENLGKLDERMLLCIESASSGVSIKEINEKNKEDNFTIDGQEISTKTLEFNKLIKTNCKSVDKCMGFINFLIAKKKKKSSTLMKVFSSLINSQYELKVQEEAREKNSQVVKDQVSDFSSWEPWFKQQFSAKFKENFSKISADMKASCKNDEIANEAQLSRYGFALEKTENGVFHVFARENQGNVTIVANKESKNFVFPEESSVPVLFDEICKVAQKDIELNHLMQFAASQGLANDISDLLFEHSNGKDNTIFMVRSDVISRKLCLNDENSTLTLALTADFSPNVQMMTTLPTHPVHTEISMTFKKSKNGEWNFSDVEMKPIEQKVENKLMDKSSFTTSSTTTSTDVSSGSTDEPTEVI